jgi:hypothetical protein
VKRMPYAQLSERNNARLYGKTVLTLLQSMMELQKEADDWRKLGVETGMVEFGNKQAGWFQAQADYQCKQVGRNARWAFRAAISSESEAGK